MARKREPDNLAKDAARALAAGMSYGKWKPLNPHTMEEKIVVPAQNTKPCEICGKLMKKGGVRRKYCCEECSHKAKLMRDNECKRRRIAKRQALNGDANK